MAPPPLKCQVMDCEFVTDSMGTLPTYEMSFRALELHIRMAHPTLAPPPTVSQPRGEESAKPDKLPRPTVTESITEAEWIHFEEKWRRYKRYTGLKGQQVVDQLWACASTSLETSCYNSGISGEHTTESELLEAMKKFAIKAQNKLVNVVEFLAMCQDTDEPVSAFLSRLRGQAKVCEFNVECTCKKNISYTDPMITHQLIRGLENPATQEKVLALAATEKKEDLTLSKIAEFVEAQETGINSSKLLGGNASINRLSEFQKNKMRDRSSTLPAKITEVENTDDGSKCEYCGKLGHGRKADLVTRKNKCPAWGQKCSKCQKRGHFATVCKSRIRERGTNNSADVEETNQIDSFGFFSLTTPLKKTWRKKSLNLRALTHQAVDEFHKWSARKPDPQPQVEVLLAVCHTGYQQLGITQPRNGKQSMATALPDTGAQMVVAGPNTLHKLGVTKSELIPLSSGVNAANNQQLKLLGGLLLLISGTGQDGVKRISKQLCYIAEGISRVFLSKSACKDLGIISPDFPVIGKFGDGANESLEVNKCDIVDPDDHNICKCARRELPPPVPAKIPFPPIKENIPKLKQWIVENYSKSAFNCCENQLLPLVSGSPPMSLYVDEKVKPVAFHKPYPVPLHFQKQVKESLDNDVKLGVLEKVEVGEPTTWCSRMVIQSKKDGGPRRTVDLQQLNKHCVRQTHSVKAPFHQATAIPANTWRTCLDAWNGYHSIPLREEDRHLTTFICPWGRYRYRCLPQGFLAANDGYTARCDEITKDFDNLERCVDDAAMWDETIEGNFFRTCKYLTVCSGAGILFSKKKFQFCQREIDFLGFKVDSEGVKPSDEFLEAIRDFPKPTDIVGIRSWFGLVEQCSYAFAKTQVMEPFRHLLKPKMNFEWTQTLQEAFETSKAEILKKVEDGIKTFDINKVTSLEPDWCKLGLGFHLRQKQCKCEELTPLCCEDGWSLVFAGSRFTRPAEKNYSPVEGECLAAEWAMNKCKYFLLGCKSFILGVDHKPLLGILNDKEMDQIDNRRLARLKEKTLKFNFTMVHIPGRLHKTADATSRQPVSEPKDDDYDDMLGLACIRSDPTEEDAENSIRIEQDVAGMAECKFNGLYDDELEPFGVMAASIRAVTWMRVKEESSKDNQIRSLVSLIESGMPEKKDEWPENLKVFFQVKSNLVSQSPIALYKDRVIIPSSLKQEILEVLHSANSGVSSMVARASDSVWWPGMHGDIEELRKRCRSCEVSTPSQPAAPPTPLPSPEYPFQQICSDYFSYKGHKYLVIVDRFSNWITIYHTRIGDGAEKLVKMIRHHFETYGASSELASDGGKEYVAKVTTDFMKLWGCHHRLSSAYNPHSNQRAEVAVKVAKRIIRQNTNPNGSLDNDKFSRAILNYRNTPMKDIGLSPAQILFNRPLKDHLPILPGKYKPRKEWRLNQESRELALAKRYGKQEQVLTEHTKELPALQLGSKVSVQNQVGLRAKKWDRTGVIVEVKPHQQYKVRMHGSGQVTLRNRRYLRQITTFQDIITAEVPTTRLPSCTPASGTSQEIPAPATRRSTRVSVPPMRFNAG